MNKEQIQALTTLGLTNIVYYIQDRSIVAAFQDADDADLFLGSCLPASADGIYYSLAKVNGAKVVDTKSGEVFV